jgi:glycosyltransferase involved in cell wall biosynthesis
VPGEPQIPFAQKLGFSGKRLATGFYCADIEPFMAIYEKRKTTPLSQKILYIGRYLELKGVRELWSAFVELSDEFPEWELHCIGTGELWESREIHPKIIHHGFKQPHELAPFLADAACFVMPSKKEPWGVVLHEMAIVGLPLIATKNVGAANAFLAPGKNGYAIELSELTEKIKQFYQLSDADQRIMGNCSHKIGTQHLPKNWSANLMNLL